MRECEVEGCDRAYKARGMCLMHYKRVRARGTTEPWVGYPPKPTCSHCEREAIARGLCTKHWKQWRLHGDPLHADNRRAERLAAGPRLDRAGYVLIPGKTMAPEHRHITNAKPGEVVHHINGIRHDNRLENLAVLPSDVEHREVHTSLVQMAYELVRDGTLSYDRGTMRYVRSGS